MVQYIIRRILLSIPVLFGILLVTFTLGRMIKGEPCTAMLGERASRALCEEFTRKFGLDQPIPVQFGLYFSHVVRGDFGDSIRFSRPVVQIMIERLPVTIELSLAALTVALVVGIPLGVISAVRHNSAIDVVSMVGANIGVSMPVFWLGLMLAYVFALVLKDTPFSLPPSGRLSAGTTSIPFFDVYGLELARGTAARTAAEFFSNLVILNSIITGQWRVLGDALRHLVLPAVALSTIPLAIIARMTRSSLLEVLGQDYVRTARAKGLREPSVVLKHALRNALLPVVTIVGLSLGGLLGGAVLTESIFSLAGVGRSLFEAITARDYPIIQAFTVIIAAGYVIINLLVDLSYAYLDPRIRYT